VFASTTAGKLRRVRWAVRAVLMLGVTASVVANVLHAQANPISRTISAWPPLALLLTVELISRVPVHSRSLAVTRILATTAIAGIAAWASYWHMAAVAARYGETGATAYLLPLSVDGLIVVASICLLELSDQLTAAEDGPVHAAADLDVDPVVDRDDEPWPDPWLYAVPVRHDPVHELPADPVREPAHDPVAEPRLELVREPARPPRVNRSATTGGSSAQRVVAAHRREPDATHERIAELAGVSVSSVKRHRPDRLKTLESAHA